MSNPRTSDDRNPPRTPPAESLVARIHAPADGPIICTLVPPVTSETRRPADWISAQAGSFVPLVEMR